MSEIGKINYIFYIILYRAYIYWRMLSLDPERTKKTVLCEKPTIELNLLRFDDDFLEDLINNLGKLSSVE